MDRGRAFIEKKGIRNPVKLASKYVFNSFDGRDFENPDTAMKIFIDDPRYQVAVSSTDTRSDNSSESNTRNTGTTVTTVRGTGGEPPINTRETNTTGGNGDEPPKEVTPPIDVVTGRVVMGGGTANSSIDSKPEESRFDIKKTLIISAVVIGFYLIFFRKNGR